MNERGFDNGTPEWEMFLQAPVSTECTVRVVTTGTLTDKGLDRLIEYINLVKDGFSIPDDQVTDADLADAFSNDYQQEAK